MVDSFSIIARVDHVIEIEFVQIAHDSFHEVLVVLLGLKLLLGQLWLLLLILLLLHQTIPLLLLGARHPQLQVEDAAPLAMDYKVDVLFGFGFEEK